MIATLDPTKSRTANSGFRRWLVVAIVFAIALAGCSLGQSDQSNETDQSATAESTSNSASNSDSLLPGNDAGPKPDITLAVTDWTAAQANGLIAEKLIERRLGYPVTLVDVVDIESLLDDLSSGEVSAVLEVWSSTLEESEIEFVNSGEVTRLGDLGVTAKVGWYVPRYVIEDDPTLATWEGYLSPAVARKFSTAETGTSGRFLGTNPDYVTFDEELIEALNVPFVVEYSGSDQATRAELRAATARKEPVLVYWWTPTAEITEFDLVNVKLPDRDDDCVQEFTDGRLLRCDYAQEQLVKLGYPGLEGDAPDLNQFLKNFTITTDDQLAITHAVEAEGKTLDEVTTQWISDNQDRWESWLEADD